MISYISKILWLYYFMDIFKALPVCGGGGCVCVFPYAFS